MIQSATGSDWSHVGVIIRLDEIVKVSSRIMASKIPFIPKQRRKIKADDEFICSEYVVRCYSSIFIDLKWNKRGFITPSDFAADENFELGRCHEVKGIV